MYGSFTSSPASYEEQGIDQDRQRRVVGSTPEAPGTNRSYFPRFTRHSVAQSWRYLSTIRPSNPPAVLLVEATAYRVVRRLWHGAAQVAVPGARRHQLSFNRRSFNLSVIPRLCAGIVDTRAAPSHASAYSGSRRPSLLHLIRTSSILCGVRRIALGTSLRLARIQFSC